MRFVRDDSTQMLTVKSSLVQNTGDIVKVTVIRPSDDLELLKGYCYEFYNISIHFFSAEIWVRTCLSKNLAPVLNRSGTGGPPIASFDGGVLPLTGNFS